MILKHTAYSRILLNYLPHGNFIGIMWCATNILTILTCCIYSPYWTHPRVHLEVHISAACLCLMPHFYMLEETRIHFDEIQHYNLTMMGWTLVSILLITNKMTVTEQINCYFQNISNLLFCFCIKFSVPECTLWHNFSVHIISISYHTYYLIYSMITRWKVLCGHNIITLNFFISKLKNRNRVEAS